MQVHSVLLLKTFWQLPTTFSESATKTHPSHSLCWHTKPKTLYWNSRSSNFSNSSWHFITAVFHKCCYLCKISLPHLTMWQRPAYLPKRSSDDSSSFVISHTSYSISNLHLIRLYGNCLQSDMKLYVSIFTVKHSFWGNISILVCCTEFRHKIDSYFRCSRALPSRLKARVRLQPGQYTPR